MLIYTMNLVIGMYRKKTIEGVLLYKVIELLALVRGETSWHKGLHSYDQVKDPKMGR